MSLSVPYCGGCRIHCCGGVEGFRPVLMPWEDKDTFFGLVEQRGKLTLVRQRACGTCVFYHQANCGIYDKRPFECRIYPFILDLSKDVRLRIDPRATCAQFVVVTQGRDLLKAIARQEIPADWARAYMFFQGGLRVAEKKERESGGPPPL